MGRTSRILELIEKMARKGGLPGMPTVAQVTTALQPYQDKIHELESRIEALEKPKKEDKKHGN